MLEFLFAVVFIALAATVFFAVLTAGEDPRLDPWQLTWQEVVWLVRRMVLLHDAGKAYLRRFAVYRWFEAVAGWFKVRGWWGLVLLFVGKAVLLGYLPLLLGLILGLPSPLWLWISPAAYAVGELSVIFVVRQVPVLWRRWREWKRLLARAVACGVFLLAIGGLFLLTLTISVYAAGPIRP